MLFLTVSSSMVERRLWSSTRAHFVVHHTSRDAWGGCGCAPGACKFLSRHVSLPLLRLHAPAAQLKWGAVFAGYHCVNTFYLAADSPWWEGALEFFLYLAHWDDEGHGMTLLDHLLEQGADVEARGVEGFACICLAAHRCDLEGMTLLLRHGADVNTLDRKGLSCLSQLGDVDGCLANDVVCIHFLLRRGLRLSLVAQYLRNGCDDPTDSRALERFIYVARIFPRLKRARNALFVVLLVQRRVGPLLSSLPPEIMELITQMVWNSQVDNVWV